MRAWIAVVVTLTALVVTAAAAAADCAKTSVSDLEDEVMCPVCGTSLGGTGEIALKSAENEVACPGCGGLRERRSRICPHCRRGICGNCLRGLSVRENLCADCLSIR